MSDDTFIYTPPPDEFSPATAGNAGPQGERRALGGLGRLPAALIVAGGLMIGGGIGGFVMASAASTPPPTASPSSPGTTPSTPHHCTHMPGGSTSGSPAAAGSVSSLSSY
jgi:hypothetical protein